MSLGIAQNSPEAETRILYVRHGEVPGNDPNPATYIYTGSGTDDSLTNKGRVQAEECANKIVNLQKKGILGPVTAIYASNLKRSKETASPIAKELGLEIQERYNLREIHWGCADGQLVEAMKKNYGAQERQVEQEYPERKIRWDYLPVFEGAETYNALLKRTQVELQDIAESQRGKTVLVIGHGRVLKTLIADAKDSEKDIPYPANCGVAEFAYSSAKGLQFIKVLEG